MPPNPPEAETFVGIDVSKAELVVAVGSELKLMLAGASELVRQVHPESSAGELAKY